MHAKYSRSGSVDSVVKDTCSKKPECSSKRMLVSETNDTLWNSLVQLFVEPERIHSLIAPAPENDLDVVKKDLASVDRDQKALKEKQERLLNLYLEGNVPQATYVVKSSALEAEDSCLRDKRADLQQWIQSHGKREVTADLIQTLRVLARSHRRFTEEQKTNVFRSMVKEARFSASGIELEMYSQPIQNVSWKYRQKRLSNTSRPTPSLQTVRIQTARQLTKSR